MDDKAFIKAKAEFILATPDERMLLLMTYEQFLKIPAIQLRVFHQQYMALRDKSSIPEIRIRHEFYMPKRYKGEANLPPELRAQKVVLLKRIGKVLGVKDYSKMKRAELIQVLYEHLNANPPIECEYELSNSELECILQNFHESWYFNWSNLNLYTRFVRDYGIEIAKDLKIT